MAKKPNGNAKANPKAKKAEVYAPKWGESVTIKIREGHALRDPSSLRKLQDGDVVTWTTHYQRALNNGALEVEPYKPVKPS